MCPVMRMTMIHTSSLKDHFECVMYYSKYRFVIMNDDTSYIIMYNIFLTHLEIVMSRDSDSWLEILISKIDSLYINQVWTMVEAPMGLTQQVAFRDTYSNFCFYHTPSREVVSSGRTNTFMNSDSL